MTIKTRIFIEAKKSGKIYQIKKINEDGTVLIKGIEDGEEKAVKETTINRSYQESDYKPAKAAKKEPKVIDMTKTNAILDYIRTWANEHGVEDFDIKVKGINSLKIGGNMMAAYSYSKNGVIIWTRSKAITGLYIPEDYPVKTMNHMFDARIKFEELTEDSGAILGQILDQSAGYQIEKKNNTKKAIKEREKAARAAKKAEEAAKANREVADQVEEIVARVETQEMIKKVQSQIEKGA